MKDDVQYHFDFCQRFSGVVFHVVPFEAHVFGIQRDGVYPMVPGDVNGPLVMPFLGDDRHGVLAEHFLGSHHGVIGAEPRIVKEDDRVGNSERNQGSPHAFGLVVAQLVIVAAD